MTGRDWLRAMVLRDRRKTIAVDGRGRTGDRMPSGIITFDGELSEADAERLRARFRQAVAPVARRVPLPTIDPPGCTCDLIYSRCYCPART